MIEINLAAKKKQEDMAKAREEAHAVATKSFSDWLLKKQALYTTTPTSKYYYYDNWDFGKDYFG